MLNIRSSSNIFTIIFIVSAGYVFSCSAPKHIVVSKPITEKIVDTVIVKPIVVTAPIKTIELTSVEKDTVLVREITRVENTGIDTAQLYGFLDQYHGERMGESGMLREEIIALEKTIISLQAVLYAKSKIADSMKTRLDTTKQAQSKAKITLVTTENVLFDIPTTMGAIAFTAFWVVWLLYTLIKRKHEGRYPFHKNQRHIAHS